MQRLNAYHFTEQFIREGLAFLTHRVIPEQIQFESRRDEFRARYKGMHTLDGVVLMVGAKQVVPKTRVEATLAAIYKSLGEVGGHALEYVGQPNGPLYAARWAQIHSQIAFK